MYPLLGLLVLCAQDPPPDQPGKDLGLTADVLAWDVSPGGWVTITRGSRAGTGTPVHLGSEVDLEPGFAPELEGRWEFLESHAVGIRGSLLDLSGTGVTDEGFVYHGVVFDAGRTVHAELDFATVQFDYRYTALRTEVVRLGLHLGAEYWDFSMRLRTADALPSLDTQRSFSSAFWMTGVDVDWRPHPQVDLLFRALGGTERSRQYFFDLDARALWSPWKNVGVSLGYRYQAVRFRQSTNQSHFRFQGPEVGIDLRF